MKIFFSVVLLAGACFADVTAHGYFNASKAVAFNAAVQAVDVKWHLRNANAAHGDLWFTTTDKLQDSPFDAGVLIQEKEGRAELELVLRPLKKEPKQSDADQILAQLLKSMAGKTSAPAVVGLINREGKNEAVLYGIDVAKLYQIATRVAKQQGHLVRMDAAAGQFSFVSNTAPSQISLGISLVDQFGDVRISAKHWTVNGGSAGDEVHADHAFTEFIEALESEIVSDQAAKGN
jgi:hypothetical protein